MTSSSSFLSSFAFSLRRFISRARGERPSRVTGSAHSWRHAHIEIARLLCSRFCARCCCSQAVKKETAPASTPGGRNGRPRGKQEPPRTERLSFDCGLSPREPQRVGGPFKVSKDISLGRVDAAGLSSPRGRRPREVHGPTSGSLYGRDR